MKNKLKKLLVAIVACLTFVVCGIFAACGGTEKIEIDGFEVKETVNVDYGSLVKLETPFVTDKNGKFYDVMTDVCDSAGGYVVVQANSFRAWDIGGYTIRYVVRVNGAQLEERTTAVTVTDTQALTVTATYNEFEDTDKNILIRPECDETGVEWLYSVKKLKDESGVLVTTDEAGAYFVCDEAGYYGVEITAKKGEKVKNMRIKRALKVAFLPYLNMCLLFPVLKKAPFYFRFYGYIAEYTPLFSKRLGLQGNLKQ